MKEFFKELFEYNHYCNQKLNSAFIDSHMKNPERAVRLFNHILNAHQIWNNRMDGKQPTFKVWELHKITDLKDIIVQNFEQTSKILDNLDLSKNIDYKLSNGQPFTNSLQNILFHIINHSTYHRGQIAIEFKKNGYGVLVSEYILFKKLDNT